jgi:hypothetical protein
MFTPPNSYVFVSSADLQMPFDGQVIPCIEESLGPIHLNDLHISSMFKGDIYVMINTGHVLQPGEEIVTNYKGKHDAGGQAHDDGAFIDPK